MWVKERFPLLAKLAVTALSSSFSRHKVGAACAESECMGRPGTSRHRKAQRFAAVGHVDGCKTRGGETAAAAVALLVDLELVLARAKNGGAAPVQRLVLEPDSAVFVIDGLGEAENSLGLPGDVGVQALAGIDAVPAAADHVLAVVDADRSQDLVRRVVAPGQSGGGGRLNGVDHGGEKVR